MNAPSIDWNREWSGVSSSLIVLAIAACLFVGTLWLTVIERRPAATPQPSDAALVMAQESSPAPVAIPIPHLAAAPFSDITHTMAMTRPRQQP